MSTDTTVVLDPGIGGKVIRALLLTDGTTVVSVSALVVANDGVSDPTAVSIANPIPVATLPPAPVLYTVFISAVSGVVKASPGNVYSFKAVNRNAVARYVQLFALASVPAPSATIFDQFLVPALGIVIFGTDFFTVAGIPLATGIAFGFSTTAGTYVPATAADHDFSMAHT